MDNNMINAIIAGNAGVYSSPAYDKKGARDKSNMWTKFVDSFDWDKIGKVKKQKTVGNVLSSLGRMNVMIKK